MTALNLIKMEVYWTEISNHPLPVSSSTPVAYRAFPRGAALRGRGGRNLRTARTTPGIP